MCAGVCGRYTERWLKWVQRRRVQVEKGVVKAHEGFARRHEGLYAIKHFLLDLSAQAVDDGNGPNGADGVVAVTLTGAEGDSTQRRERHQRSSTRPARHANAMVTLPAAHRADKQDSMQRKPRLKQQAHDDYHEHTRQRQRRSPRLASLRMTSGVGGDHRSAGAVSSTQRPHIQRDQLNHRRHRSSHPVAETSLLSLDAQQQLAAQVHTTTCVPFLVGY